MIDIKNLSFKYEENEIFNNLNMHIDKGNIVSIIGNNGSGKSTLIKLFSGLYNFQGNIIINGKSLDKKNLKDIKKQFGYVLTNPDNQFVSETVMDEIAFSLENLNFKKSDIINSVKEISKYLGIYDILESNPHNLNNNQKYLVLFASAIIHKPKILVLDDCLSLFDPFTKDKIINILKELNKNGMTILIFTNDIEDTLISDYIYVLDNKNIILEGKKDDVYEEEDILHSIGMKLPFMVELSNRMIFYGLIDKVIYDMEEMVDELWK